jgi:hypothetical protein
MAVLDRKVKGRLVKVTRLRVDIGTGGDKSNHNFVGLRNGGDMERGFIEKKKGTFAVCTFTSTPESMTLVRPSTSLSRAQAKMSFMREQTYC